MKLKEHLMTGEGVIINKDCKIRELKNGSRIRHTEIGISSAKVGAAMIVLNKKGYMSLTNPKNTIAFIWTSKQLDQLIKILKIVQKIKRFKKQSCR